MSMLTSWRALLVREYREHRIAFFYFPAGIMALLALAALSALFSNRLRLVLAAMPTSVLKIFELGELLLVALWFAYLGVTLFFYFGDAFSADRRNNAMFFWKSMPVSDLKILSSKFLAGVTLFPLIGFAMMVVSGLIYLVLIAIAQLLMPDLVAADLGQLLSSFIQIEGYAVVRLILSLLWYAPFLAWVGALSAVFGRWSLPLAFVIPGLVSVIENIAFFGYVPRGGYVWAYLGKRLHFGNDLDMSAMVLDPRPFQSGTYVSSFWHQVDWPNLIGGLVVAALLIWAASEYRRRRIA
jgi:ABC-2 type transport system permease protein